MSAPQTARVFLSLPREIQEKVARLDREKLLWIFHVTNKQRAKFLRGGYGEGLTGLLTYCELKSGQNAQAIREKNDKFSEQ